MSIRCCIIYVAPGDVGILKTGNKGERNGEQTPSENERKYNEIYLNLIL